MLSPFHSPFQSPFRSPMRSPFRSPFKNFGHPGGRTIDFDCEDDEMNLNCFILMFDLLLKQVAEAWASFSSEVKNERKHCTAILSMCRASPHLPKWCSITQDLLQTPLGISQRVWKLLMWISAVMLTYENGLNFRNTLASLELILLSKLHEQKVWYYCWEGQQLYSDEANFNIFHTFIFKVNFKREVKKVLMRTFLFNLLFWNNFRFAEKLQEYYKEFPNTPPCNSPDVNIYHICFSLSFSACVCINFLIDCLRLNCRHDVLLSLNTSECIF